MSTPALSLILASRNRLASLRALLERLAEQSPALDWELLVVDNGSRDGTAAWLEAQHFPRALTVLSEPLPGKSRALNLGLERARGELLAFTDDDVMPADGWLAAFVEAAARNPSANVFGGRILPDPAAVPRWVARAQNLQEMLLSEHDLGPDECLYPPYRYPIGPSMAVRAAAVAARGARWPLDRGPGTRLPLGDERGFLTAVSNGPDRDRLYVPGALVTHAPEPEQLALRAAALRCLHGGYVAGRLDATVARPLARGAALTGQAARRLRVASAAEFVCVLARATGVFAGRAHGRLQGIGGRR